MKGRRPRRDELDLWSRVARTARELPGRTARVSEQSGPARAKKTDPPGEAPAGPSSAGLPPDFRIGANARPNDSVRLPRSTSDRLAADGVAMDAKAYGRLKRGKLAPEARLDLHGMTLEEAHPALAGFVHSAHARGFRLVLVITGKGQREDPFDPLPRRRGVLRTQVPQWLRMPPLAPLVLQVSEAHVRHGGQGAYYVYLRRRR